MALNLSLFVHRLVFVNFNACQNQSCLSRQLNCQFLKI